ncbi:hypothetical protein AKG95_24715 [Janthinobacterium lividum]|uniref:Uncharacterized protein n=1 Tax=Janthinobacterium lividum TaxID=29581 RepID=A0A1S1U2P2_9BURK|nr:hypothetical protein AKG95_24715 [Janthinobacterium lividum]
MSSSSARNRGSLQAAPACGWHCNSRRSSAPPMPRRRNGGFTNSMFTVTPSAHLLISSMATCWPSIHAHSALSPCQSMCITPAMA